MITGELSVNHEVAEKAVRMVEDPKSHLGRRGQWT